MSTPNYKRTPAKMDMLKKTKALEMYTIKKVCNEKHFSKKKYRRFLTKDLIELSKNTFTYLVKSFYSTNTEKAYDYAEEALLNMDVMLAQLDVANTLYSTSIPNIEYWSELIVDVKESINIWIKNIKTL